MALEHGYAVYDRIGTTYGRYRRPDPRIADVIDAALDGVASVLSVGSGTGSYEPPGVGVVAVEPSRTMIAQRPAGAAPVVQGIAESLPFADGRFDAALAVLTIHHWGDPERGMRELARVSRRQAILTWDPSAWQRFWLMDDYLPEMVELESGLPTLRAVEETLLVRDVVPVPVPWDCTDGFCGAYWRRPERYLDPNARAAISGFARCADRTVARAMHRLERDLSDGSWYTRYGHLLRLDELDLGYRLVTAAGVGP